MVVDNADDADMFFARPIAESSLELKAGPRNPFYFYLPQSLNGSILFTTRDKGATVKLTNRGKIIMVLPMSLSEAEHLLHRSLQEDEWDESVAEDLLETLDHLPLAIALPLLSKAAPRAWLSCEVTRGSWTHEAQAWATVSLTTRTRYSTGRAIS